MCTMNESQASLADAGLEAWNPTRLASPSHLTTNIRGVAEPSLKMTVLPALVSLMSVHFIQGINC